MFFELYWQYFVAGLLLWVTVKVGLSIHNSRKLEQKNEKGTRTVKYNEEGELFLQLRNKYYFLLHKMYYLKFKANLFPRHIFV